MINLINEYNLAIGEKVKQTLSEIALVAEQRNINIFLIGGIVRDLILKNPIKDIDIAIETDAIKFGDILTQNFNCEIVKIQENLHTIKVKFLNGVIIDFASTREEKYSNSGILPIAYNFGCELEKDIKRRDFTINTLALKLTGNDKFTLIDYVQGYSDILNKKIRILHKNSFIDDPSRIIRALKFKIRLNFDIENKTYLSMQEYLQNVNTEMPLTRIKNELKQYFSINKKGIYKYLIESKAYKLLSDNTPLLLNENLINELKKYDFLENLNFKYIYLLSLFINSDYEEPRYNLNSFEKNILKEVINLLNKSKQDFDTNEKIYSLLSDISEYSIVLYYAISGNQAVKKFLTALKDINVLVTGKDLIEAGFIPSPFFNELFEKILKEKLNGKLKTKEEEIKFIKRFLK